MTTSVLLDSREHNDLCIDARFAAELGDNVMWAQTFAAEFRHLQAYYPILFQKDSNTDQFSPVALFGFQAGENLFLKQNAWDAGYIPLMMQRIPFSIGRYSASEQAEEKAEEKRLLHIDTSHPKVSKTAGTRLFAEHGAPSPFLEKISGMMETIHQWNQNNTGFINAVTELGLLEQVAMDITLADGDKGQLLGFYTINENRLGELEKDALFSLHQHGYLEPIYMAMASLNNISALAARKTTGSQA